MNKFLRCQVLTCLLATFLFLDHAQAYTYSVLTKFKTTNGASPYAPLVQGADGSFYGTTTAGGSNGYGTIFKVTSSGVLTTLVNFNNTNGANPYAALIQGYRTDTNFYGTTTAGGSFGYGTIFKVTPSGVLTTLVNFNKTNGANPFSSLYEDSDGNFYGTTEYGGSSNMGTIYKYSSTGVLSTLTTFSGSNGARPFARLIQGLDGNFYGTTFYGGSSDDGTVFKVTSAGALTTLVNFNNTNGRGPYAGLVQDKYGTFYGTTFYSGTGDGTFFSLNSSRVLTTLVTFNNNNGAFPQGDMVQGPDGEFYGTTQDGGPAGAGTVFKVTSAGGLTTLIDCSANDGFAPEAGVVLGTDGNFYGTMSLCGSYGSGFAGAIYRLNPTTVTTYPFNSVSAIGETNQGFIINGSAINLNLGVPLSVGTVLTAIHNTGGSPLVGAFTDLPNGGTITANYYSATYNLTANYAGNGGDDLTLTVKSATSYSVIDNLNFQHAVYGGGPAYQAVPYAGLALGKDGNFYGTDEYGGPWGAGEIFRVTPSGVWTSLADFDDGPNSDEYGGPLYYNGAIPTGTMCLGRDGNFYGTTSSGSSTGNTEDGTIYKYNPSTGSFKSLVDFTGANGSAPIAGLVQGRDGNFYGTTSSGGASGDGTVFKVTSTGVLTTLVSFNGTNGANPEGGLVQGGDNAFYGTTYAGGTTNQGTVFKVTSAGVLTTLYNFYLYNFGGVYFSSGTFPLAGLLAANDGNFYGTTSSGGANNQGTVFKITSGGTLTVLFVLDGTTHGANPSGTLIQGNDGNFYGTTSGGGKYGYGTAFKVAATGAFTSLFSFTGTNGANPIAGLVQGTDGNFYGLTPNGGSDPEQPGGVIFRF